MKQLTVWLLQTGEPLHTDAGNPRPMRAMNLANALTSAGHRVVLWSAGFYHQEKRHRCTELKRLRVSPLLEIVLIPSPGYKRNIGIGRLWDHAVLGWRLSQLLKQEPTPPDVAFIGYPPIETAAVMAKWLAKTNVPCLLDVKDQWPTIFIEALPKALRPVGRLALAPYFYLGRRAMRDATALSAMADAFLAWAHRFAGRTATALDRVVPLTTPVDNTSMQELDDAGVWWDQQGIRADGTPRFVFVGSHSVAFDIDPICAAAKLLQHQATPVQFVICGDGLESKLWREKMADLSNVYFPGWIDREKVQALALRSTATLAPYHNNEDFLMSIPNKVIDSMALGLPVLTPLRGEVSKLVVEHNMGLIYTSGSQPSLADCINRLLNDAALHDQMSRNALQLYQDRFSFAKVYGGLVEHLELLAQQRATRA